MLGYEAYSTGGCEKRDEQGWHINSRDDCADGCNQDKSCISFEYRKIGQLCRLSTSCSYNLTVKDASVDFCFYEKQGSNY